MGTLNNSTKLAMISATVMVSAVMSAPAFGSEKASSSIHRAVFQTTDLGVRFGSVFSQSGRLVYRSRKRSDESRLAHARELLGRKSTQLLKRIEGISDVGTEVTSLTREAFKGTRWSKRADSVARTILDESARYGYDPIFLLAVIRNESQFNPLAIGTSGEIGLMQILPVTAQWVCDRMDLAMSCDSRALKDPVKNVKIGAAYISILRHQFDAQGGLYLAAYNMGSKNVHRALAKNIMPKDYSRRVMGYYLEYYRTLKKADS